METPPDRRPDERATPPAASDGLPRREEAPPLPPAAAAFDSASDSACDSDASSDILIEPSGSLFHPRAPLFLSTDFDPGSDPASDPASERSERLFRERRRYFVRRELRSKQKSSFVTFGLAFLVPTAALLLAVVAVVTDDAGCAGAAAGCAKEPRVWKNAYTARCVCDAVAVRSVEDVMPT